MNHRIYLKTLHFV